MSKKFNQPTVQFCIEVRHLPGCEVVDRYVIEQNEGHPITERSSQRIYNQVQKHLNELAIKTGCAYQIVRWGAPIDRRAWLAGFPLGMDEECFTGERVNG